MPTPDPDPPETPDVGGAEAPSPGLPLMITRRQRERLRAMGFSDDAIRDMTPVEAHGHLGL